jgi:hypothetical protein
MKLCIVLQYWERDRERAMELARFIAELEPRHRDDVAFIFFCRWDATAPDPVTCLKVSAKFATAYAFTSKYKWQGWPAGPNGIAREVLEAAPDWLRHNFLPRFLPQLGFDRDVDALLMLEPDCVPFDRFWLNQMINEWCLHGHRKDLSLPGDAWQIGAWRDSGGPGGHINGNCLIRADVAKVIPLQVITEHFAWDCAIAPLMRNHWRDSPLFVNHFQSTNATKEKIPPNAVLVHGYKDDSAMQLARHYLL